MICKLITKDDPLLIPFIKECKRRGFNNNSSIEKMKFDFYDYCRFIAVVKDQEIVAISGVHKMHFNSQTFYRCGFRGVTLKPGQQVSRNYRKTSYNVGITWYLLMRLVLKEKCSNPTFIVTTNDYRDSVESAGGSHRADRFYKIHKPEGYALLYEKALYMHTVQNIWQLDFDVWKRDFYKYHATHISLDGSLKHILEDL